MPSRRTPWNKGKLVGQKTPLRLSDIWSIRVRLQLGKNARDLALFNLAIDSTYSSRSDWSCCRIGLQELHLDH